MQTFCFWWSRSWTENINAAMPSAAVLHRDLTLFYPKWKHAILTLSALLVHLIVRTIYAMESKLDFQIEPTFCAASSCENRVSFRKLVHTNPKHVSPIRTKFTKLYERNMWLLVNKNMKSKKTAHDETWSRCVWVEKLDETSVSNSLTSDIFEALSERKNATKFG